MWAVAPSPPRFPRAEMSSRRAGRPRGACGSSRGRGSRGPARRGNLSRSRRAGASSLQLPGRNYRQTMQHRFRSPHLEPRPRPSQRPRLLNRVLYPPRLPLRPLADPRPGPAPTGPPSGQIEPGVVGGGNDALSLLEGGSETGGFKAEGPPVAVPVDEAGAGRPARVLEVGSGQEETNLGLPPEKSLVDVTPTDINPRPGAERLDATADVPPHMVGQYDTIIINNPRRYQPDIAKLGEALRPGGRIIVQGKAEAEPGQRGINPDFNKMMKAPPPPGYKKIIDVEPGPPTRPTQPSDIMGGPFFRTEGTPVGWPSRTSIYEKLPVAAQKK